MDANPRWSGVGLLLAVLAHVPALAQPAPPATAVQPQSRPAAPAQDPAAAAGVRRLGRKYPAPMPPPLPRRRDEPRAYVAIVSPQDSGVHQKLGGRGMRSRLGRGTGGLETGTRLRQQSLEPVQ